jgi:hypothetical protein
MKPSERDVTKMEREEISPLATSITLGEEIHRFIDNIRGLLALGLATSCWIITLAVFWLAGFPRTLASFYVIWGIVGAFIVLFNAAYMRSSYRIFRSLKEWNDKFIRFSYVLKFEILPSSKKNPVERIFEQILNVFVELGDIFESNQIDYEAFVNANVEGKKSSHVFDIYSGVENSGDQKELHKFHSSHGDLFVRRFVGKNPVRESDLRTLSDEVSDVVKMTKAENVFRIVVVSAAPFDESALDFVKNKKNWAKTKSADLIQETSEGFRVIWVS